MLGIEIAGGIILAGIGLAALYDRRARRHGRKVNPSIGEVENRLNTDAQNYNPMMTVRERDPR